MFELFKKNLFSGNSKIAGASLIISILPLLLICPIAERFSDISFVTYLPMLIPVVIYVLMLSRLIKSGYISIKDNYVMFGLNFLASIVFLAVCSTVFLKISALSL